MLNILFGGEFCGEEIFFRKIRSHGNLGKVHGKWIGSEIIFENCNLLIWIQLYEYLKFKQWNFSKNFSREISNSLKIFTILFEIKINWSTLRCANWKFQENFFYYKWNWKVSETFQNFLKNNGNLLELARAWTM